MITATSRTLLALDVPGVSKSFNGVTVLDGAHLKVRPGSIHALVGHNGSGKSTLIKILAGVYQPEESVEARVFEDTIRLGDHASADRAGLRFVHQDLGLVDTLSAVDNLALGPGYPTRQGLISWSTATRRTRSVLASLGYYFDVNRPVGTLSAAQRAGVAIARALQDWSGKRAVVVLDEPTAAMPAQEADLLFNAVRSLRDHGIGVVYVSHHLHEVLDLADEVTVLRAGRVVASRAVDGLDHDELVELIVGHRLEPSPAVRPLEAREDRPAPLAVRSLSTTNVADLSFEVAPGEIVGIVGVDGSGRDSILPAVAGVTHRTGDVRIAGNAVAPGRPRAAIDAGLGYVAAERQLNAVVPSMDVAANLTLAGLRTLSRRGLLSRRAEATDVKDWLGRVGVPTAKAPHPILTLSGGNQQKVMVGRWLRREPAVLLLDEPTQGVDVAARQRIYDLLRDAAAAGRAVLVASSSADEVIDLCHRVIVIAHGVQVADMPCTELTEERLNALALAPKQKA